MRNLKFTFVLGAMAGLLLFASCGSKQKTETQQQGKPKVKLSIAQAKAIEQSEDYTATVESDVKNNISPNASYRIKKIYVDVGDYVRAGQTVVQLDVANQDQLGLQIQSQIAQAESQMAQMQNQQAEFSRISELYNMGGISKSEYDAALTQLTVQKKAVAAQQNQIKALRSQLSQMSQNTSLSSPISGVVTARNYDDGDMYAGTPILTVEQLNPVKLKINVSESHYAQVKKGLPVDIKLDAYQEEVFTGKVTTVYPTIDQATHTFPVEITVNNKEGKVRPGMFGKATLNFGTENHVVVPDEALVKQVGAGDRYVYIYKDGKVKYQKVELGKHFGKDYEILEGVNPGDKIVIAGMSHLANGIEVEVEK